MGTENQAYIEITNASENNLKNVSLRIPKKKITVFTYKPKKNAKRKMGHRQPYTKIQIEAVKA